ncbi:hypothetical protein ACWGB8_02315 [Kitasatospora sp. NPDC054939]
MATRTLTKTLAAASLLAGAVTAGIALKSTRPGGGGQAGEPPHHSHSGDDPDDATCTAGSPDCPRPK